MPARIVEKRVAFVIAFDRVKLSASALQHMFRVYSCWLRHQQVIASGAGSCCGDVRPRSVGGRAARSGTIGGKRRACGCGLPTSPASGLGSAQISLTFGAVTCEAPRNALAKCLALETRLAARLYRPRTLRTSPRSNNGPVYHGWGIR